MLNEGGFKYSIVNTVNTKKIHDLLDKADVSILVGFPAGRAHVEARHDITHEGKRKGGSDVENNAQGVSQTTAELAAQLHYGSALIPARPFLDDGIRHGKEDLQKAIGEQLKKLKDGEKPNWDKVGTMAVGKIQEFVRSDYYKNAVPNSEQTIKEKGSDTPLIDGGDLIGSMTYILEGKQ